MYHARHTPNRGCRTCRLFAKLSRSESGRSWNLAAGVTESIPTIEELLQSSGCLGYGYEYGPSEDEMPPDDPLLWGVGMTDEKPADDGGLNPSAGSVPKTSQEVAVAKEDSGMLGSEEDFPPENPSAYQSSGSSGGKGNSGEMREGMWIRREESNPGMGTSRPPKRLAHAENESEGEDGPQRAPVEQARCAWLRVSGSPEIMEQFRLELAKKEPQAAIYEPVTVLGARVHQLDCALLGADSKRTHLLCPSCTGEVVASTDRLVCGGEKVLHTDLGCPKLVRTADSRILGWCGICHFGGLGEASNAGGWRREEQNAGQTSSSLSPPTPLESEDEAAEFEWDERTEDEAASDPPSSEADVAPFEI